MSCADDLLTFTPDQWERQVTIAFNRGIDTSVRMIRAAAARPDTTPDTREQLLLMASEIMAILAMVEGSI